MRFGLPKALGELPEGKKGTHASAGSLRRPPRNRHDVRGGGTAPPHPPRAAGAEHSAVNAAECEGGGDGHTCDCGELAADGDAVGACTLGASVNGSSCKPHNCSNGHVGSLNQLNYYKLF